MANNLYYWQKSEPKIEPEKYGSFQQPMWQFDWQDTYRYDEKDPYDLERKRRNIPPKSLLIEYNFDDNEDKKRFEEGFASLKMEQQQTNKKVQKDIELYQRERQRLFEQTLAQKQAENEKKRGFLGLFPPKKVDYIDPEEYAPAMPESLAGWQGYLDKMADYNETLETMDPDEKAYRTLIGSLPKEPDKPGFDLSEFVKWEDLQKDLWEEYLDKQAKQVQQPAITPTPTQTGNEQKGVQQLYPMWNQQVGPTSPVPTPTPTVKPSPTPTIQPTGTPMPTPQPTREPATFGEFQRLQEQQRQEAERQSQWKGYNRPVGGTVGTQPDIPSRSPFASGSRSVTSKNKPVSGRGLLYNLFSNDEAGREARENAVKSTNKFLGLPEKSGIQLLPSKEAVAPAKDIIDAFNSGLKGLTAVEDQDVIFGKKDTEKAIKNLKTGKEGVIQSAKEGFLQGDIQNKMAMEVYKQMMGKPNDVEYYQKLLDDNPQLMPDQEFDIKKALKDKDIGGIFKQMVRGMSTQVPMWVQGWRAGKTKAAAYGLGAAGTAAALGLAGPQALTPEEVVTVPVAGGLGAAIGQAFGSFEYFQKLMAGQSYKDLIEMGISPEIASTSSQLIGAVNAGIEQAQFGEVVKLLPGGEKVISAIQGNIKNRALNALKNYGTFMAKEALFEEVSQEVVSIAGEEISKAIDNLSDKQIEYATKNDIFDRLKDTAIDSAISMALMPIPGTVQELIGVPRQSAQDANVKNTEKETKPDTKTTKPEIKIPPSGTKATLKGLGEVEVLSETDTHVKIRRANGKELDILKTAFNSGLVTDTDSKAPDSPIEAPNVLDTQIQGQDIETSTQAEPEPQAEPIETIEQEEVLAPDTDIIQSEPATPETVSSNIVKVDPKTIKFDPKTYQFKMDVDPKTGVGKGLDIEKWDENLAGVVLLHEKLNGDLYAVNGHHRARKSLELGVDSINAMIVREADGVTDKDAKLLGAKVNIAEGHGSITDAAKLFREGGYTIEQLKAEGLPMKSGNAQKGYAIAQLTDNLFNKVVDKVITENQGAIIGQKIPSDGGINDARQEFIIKQLMNKDMTNRVLEETLDAIKYADANSHMQETLFGQELVFDTADFEIKPKVISETKRIISSDKNAFSKIVRNAESLKRVGNVLQDDANAEQKNTLEQAIELIDKMKYAKGDQIADIFNKYTSHVQAGGSVKDAGDKAAKEIIDLISDGEYINSLMGKTPKAIAAETDTIPGQANLFGEEPAQAEQTPITEPTKGGETSGETGVSQSEDSQDSTKVPRRTEADAQADAGRNLETEEGKPEVAQAEKPATEPEPQSTGALSDYDLTIQKSTTKNGNPVWELKGIKKDDTDMINVMRKFRARWYSPKKSWSFYQEEDPTPKILAEIEKVKPKAKHVVEDAKPAQEAKPSNLPDTSEYKRAGKAAFKKWSDNEYISVDIDNIDSVRTKDWIKVFDAYYQRGLSGQDQFRWRESPVLDEETNFPPFIFDEIYKAGKADYEAEQRRLEKQAEKEAAKTPAETDAKTTELEKWFGNSKAVDENGEPKVFYHGTQSRFTEFDTNRIGSRSGVGRGGFAFTDNKASADTYAKGTSSEDVARDEFVFGMNNIFKNSNESPEFNKKYIEKYDDMGFKSERWDSSTMDDDINELIERTKNYADDIEKLGAKEVVGEIRDYISNFKPLDYDPNIMEAYLKIENPITRNTDVKNYAKVMNDAQYSAKKENDGVILTVDNGDGTSSTVAVVFDPSNIRLVSGRESTKTTTKTTSKPDTTTPKKGIIESDGSKGGTSDDVRQGDTQKPTRKPADNVSSTDEGRRTGNVPGAEGSTGGSTVPTDRGRTQEGVPGERRGELSGETSTEHMDRLNDGKASTGGNTPTRRGGNDRQLEGSRNYKISADADIDAGGVQTKFKGNIDAINLLKQLEKENRKATPSEQEVLAKYSGWGGMPQAFDDRNKKWSNQFSEVKSLLTKEEYESAKGSVLNAHYTDVGIIKGMYDGLLRMGFEGGKILDPSTGTGRFIGVLPSKLGHSKVTAVELDSLTARIAKQLYPKASINNKGFQDVSMPDNFFDLAISNVPFGNYKLHDPKYNKHNFLIHDYFFAKSLDKVRPGGVVSFITSKGTMDKANPNVRKYISDRADLIGAIRLPNTTFKKSANTSVTTDVIFLRKREAGQSQGGESWFAIKKTKDGIPVNEYYINNPEMMLGTMAYDKSMYGDKKETALHPLDGDLMQAYSEAINRLPENILNPASKTKDDVDTSSDFITINSDRELKENEYTIKDGEVYQNQNGQLIPVKQKIKGVMGNVSGKRKERIEGMINVRNALREVFRTQKENGTNEEVLKARENLNKTYDSFLKRNGNINDNSNKLAFRQDPDYQLLTTLEKYNTKLNKYEKADIFSKRTITPEMVATKADTSSDALAITINQAGRVDIDKISELVGKSQEDVINELQGIIYRTPAGEWQTSDEYLSGNVRVKLAEAKLAAERDPQMQVNVKALEKVQPKDLQANEISVRLGSNWIGDETATSFVNELLGIDDAKITYIPQTGDWQVEGRSTNLAITENKYGTSRARAETLLEKILNNRTINVYDKIDDTSVLNKKETALAREKAELIKQEFQKWVYKDQNRRRALEKKYNETFNNHVLRRYNGEFLTLPGMNTNISLRDYQKNAVARMVFGGNTLLAHAVGAGKTFEMISAGMELKRLGIAHKPVYVVPNHMIEQWQKDFFKLYPNANVLAASKSDFAKDKRARFISMIATGNWDAVIISHSSFGKIGVSKQTQEAFMREEIQDVEAAIIAAKEAEEKGSSIVKQLEKTKANLEAKLKELADSESKDTYVDFEDLGIDYMFVDEAHNFKNLYFHTKMGRIAGVTNSKAKRASDMYMKTRYVSNLHNNEKGVVFATGTPISNSMPEMFTMQKYLGTPALEKAGLKHFDAWANSFGETVSSIEVDKTGRGFRSKQRFSRFFNAPELVTMFREFSDVITSDQLTIERPELEGGKPNVISVDPSDTLTDYVDSLIERSEAISSGSVDPSVDNALKVTNDGRLAALDMRLIDPNLPDDPNSKLNRAVETIFKEWEDGKREKTTQLVFSDLGTPKKPVSKAQKIKNRKIVASNGYKTFQWYIDKDLNEKYVVAKIDKEDEIVHKLYENGNEVQDNLEKNTDIATFEPSNLKFDVDDYVDSLADGDDSGVGIAVNFDIYNDVKQKLLNMGIPENEVAFIHDAKTDIQKEKLFEKVRRGEVRVIMGSTAKMGEGTNIQDRAIALHHLDAPWKPSSVEQRNGRIIRSGNMNKKVRLYHYVTKGSFDAYIWQLIENKAKFISQIMNNNLSGRQFEDAFDAVVLSSGEIKAAASDNPLIMEKLKVDQEINRLEMLKSSHLSQVYQAQDRVESFPNSIKKKEVRLERTKKDITNVIDTRGDNFLLTTKNGKKITDRKKAGKLIQNAVAVSKYNEEVLVGKLSGFEILGTKSFGDGYIIIRGNNDYTAYVTETPAGTAMAVENLLRNLPKMAQREIEEINALKDNLKSYQELINKPFEHEQTLNDLHSKQVDINNQLNLDKQDDIMMDDDVSADDLQETTTTQQRPNRSSSGVQSRATTAKSDMLTGNMEGTAENKKPISRTDLVDFIGEYLDIPIKKGKFRQRALGIFKTHPEIIRLKDGKDIETLFHEMGHYFDKKLGLVDEKHIGELYALGEPASKASYTEKEVMKEGVAEFVRLFTLDPTNAKASAPEFYKDFMRKVSLKPGMSDFFETVRVATENYINQSPENHILGNISIGPNKNKAALLSKESLDRIYTAAFDNLHPLKRAVDVITGGEKIDAKDNPFIRAWLYRGVSGKVEAILKYGPIDKNDKKIGKSLEEILSKVDESELNNFRAYITSKHAKELMKNDIATGLSKSEVERTIQKYDQQFEPILKELVVFQRNVMKPLVDSGIISADSFKKITKYEYYVPFNRVMDDTKTSGTGKGLEARDPLHRQKGSERDIVDPLESIIKNTFVYTNMADRNMIGKAFVDLASKYEGSGKIIDKIPPRLIPQTVMLKELEKVLSSAGANTTEIDLDQIATVFRPRAYTNKDNVITVFENGKPSYYEVIDEDLYNAFKALDQEQTPFVVKALSIPAQVLRAGATGLNVDFIGRNIARDTIFAGISSKYGFIPFVDSIKGLAHVLKKDETFQSWLYSGGGDSELVSVDRSRIQRYQRQLLEQSGELNVLNIVRHPMDFIRLLGEYSEQATRVGVHAKALKKEGDSISGKMLAGLASRETTVDFARMGTNVKNINKMIAFFNSALQGGDVVVRAAMRDKRKFALRAMMYITIPSILTYLLNRDDDEYEEIPQYQKDTFWLFKVGGQWYRIPKPFEMGMLFGSLVERFLAYTDKEDPHALDGWAEQLKDTALPDIIPTALLPLIEVWTEKDLFRNMPIVPQGNEYKKPADQHGPYTSSLAQTLGKAFNYSPYKIDHLIKGYGAGVGQNISNIASKGLELTGIAEKKTEPDKPLSQKLPIIRGLTVDPERSSKSVNDFYTRLNEMESDYKQMRDSDGIELNQYPKRKELRAMRKTQIELRDLNREYKEIYADNKIDSKTKREKLSNINMKRINVARKAIGKPKIRE